MGPPLFEALIANLLVILCDVDAFLHWNSSAEEGACVGLKPDLQEGTGFNLLRVQFWTPLQRKRVSKRGQKVDPLKSKVVPPGGSSFGPFFGTFIVANLLKRLFQVEADLISSSCGWNLELFEALIANLLVILCDVDAFLHWNSSAEEGACVGLKPDLQEGTGFNLLRVQFWTPLQRKRVSKRGQKVDPLKSKVVPPGGSSFGPFFGTFIVANLLKRLFQVEADLISSSCGWNLELFEALIANLLVILCDVDAFLHWNSSAEEGACVGLKPDLQEGTGFNLLRVQFWTPLQRKRVSKRGQKVDPLKSKVVPPGGSRTGEAHFCAPAFSYVLRTKTGTFFVTLFSPISIALRPSRPASRPASKLAPKCFVLIPMVSRRWSSRLALRPASNYTSSSKLFVWLQFPYP